MAAATHQTEKREFKAELKQLLHLITHSLYSNKEIFLRELISNASDAINKIKFDSLAHEEKLEGNKDWKIKIIPDRAAGTLTVSDNGIGMSRDSAVENLGTIAKSGTRAFLENLKNKDIRQQPELIGQFGVGFYSAFMVADRVTVLSRMAGDPRQGVRWESDGQGEFTVEDMEKPTRGTDVILHLKAEEQDFLDPYQLQQIVKKFSDFIEHAVVMDVEKTDENKNKTIVEETLNARKAIWLRSKSENTSEEYNTFYKQIAGDIEEPAKVIHYTAEGINEFKVLLYIPAHRPFELQWGGDVKFGPKLYIQRVLIMDHCEALLPPYLRFVKGVVDCSDLPLNISREMLQHNPLLEKIKSNVVRGVFKALEEMKADEEEKYLKFHRELGAILKEGLSRDWSNREKIADLLLFESLKTPAGQYTTLAKYVDAMPAEQKTIWYLIGEDREMLEHSPYLETFRVRGQDVLLLTDPIDEFSLPNLGKYKEKELKAVDRDEPEESKEEASKKSAMQEQFKKLFEYLKSKLSEVSDIRLSSRLKDSAACLVAGSGSMSAHLERLMERMGRGEERGPARRILELNGEHPVVRALQQLYEKDAQDPRVESYARLLYDQAVIAEGSRIKDATGFAQRINALLVQSVQNR
ncbi:MAG TPA: molecular chaperone HtpG [Gemmataceae bacterium]|jgi:molecular chaperone HtpG